MSGLPDDVIRFMEEEAQESDIIDGKPCAVCTSIFYERTDEGEDVCVECGSPKDYKPGAYDWSIYVINEGEGKLFDLRYGVHGFVGLVEAMRKALRHGGIEVKVSTRRARNRHANTPDTPNPIGTAETAHT